MTRVDFKLKRNVFQASRRQSTDFVDGGRTFTGDFAVRGAVYS
jgi:hypothetical protein